MFFNPEKPPTSCLKSTPSRQQHSQGLARPTDASSGGIRCLSPVQCNGSRWHFACAAHKGKTTHLKGSRVASPSRNHDLVTQDNPELVGSSSTVTIFFLYHHTEGFKDFRYDNNQTVKPKPGDTLICGCSTSYDTE